MSLIKSLTLELLAFDEKSTFDYFCVIWAYKARRALYAQINQKQPKVDFSSKAKSSNVRWVGIAFELWVDCAARLIINFRQYAQQPHPYAARHITKRSLECFKKYPPGGKHSGYDTDLPRKSLWLPCNPI
jgi:hypothetical protein